MKDIFLKLIDELYKIILQPIDFQYKKVAITNLKLKIDMDNCELFSNRYYIDIQKKKGKGVVYTQKEIAEYIVKNTIKKEDLIKNPFFKIIDPACGCGNMLVPCFKYLYKIYIDNLHEINEKNNLNLNETNIKKHIIDNNIFGFDIDEMALKILQIDLFSISSVINTNNFIKKDFLMDNVSEKFDVYISNPPYIGQKSIDREYSLCLKKMYNKLYKDKGDVSFCFFERALSNLNKGGKLTFITSRYFMESPSGIELRKILKGMYSIDKIIDFYGIRPFKNVGIDPVIIFIKNESMDSNKIQVIKPKNVTGDKKGLFYKSLFLDGSKEYNSFCIDKNILSDSGWILRDEKERKIINKIEKKCFTNLSNICTSYQGIITGCDKAFIISNDEVEDENIEANLLKTWIKSSYIKKKSIKNSDKFIIYSDIIINENEYPNAINHIQKFKDKLLKRRECQKGIRKWYNLQWGRKKEIFEGKKIVFPYKSESNRFALDVGSFFSADIYALVLRDNVPFTYEYLLYILNSDIYEFYFKTFAKKLGENMYEYYPNTIMKLCIPIMSENVTENYLYNMFEFDEEDIRIIKESVKNEQDASK